MKPGMTCYDYQYCLLQTDWPPVRRGRGTDHAPQD
jgi:hypothetical protein